MKTKSLAIILSMLVIVATALTGCGNDNRNDTKDQAKTLTGTVKVITQTGDGTDALASMPDGYQIQSFKTKDEVIGQILNDSYDLAIVDPVTAAKMYNQTGGKMVAISPITLDGWYIVSNKAYITSGQITDLSGKTIVSADQDGTGYAVLRKLLEDKYVNPDYRVTMNWVDTPDKVIDALKTPGTVALLSEPYVSQALGELGNDKITSDIDLNQLWQTTYGYPIPSEVVVATKQFVKNRSGDLDLFLQTVTGSIDKAKKSSTSNLVFYNSTRGMEILNNFITTLDELTLLGGKTPNTAFYYGIGE